MNYQSELEEFYAQTDAEDAYERRWGYGNSIAAEYWHMRDELVFDAIRRRLGEDLGSIRVLEVGTGYGHELAKLQRLGVPRQNLMGIDLLPARLKRAQRSYPGIKFHVADAVALPFGDNSFDLVMQFTCVMHALTQQVQHAMCAEMIRVLRSRGILLWWDLAPFKWRTLCLRRLLFVANGSTTSRQCMSYGWQTCRELLSSSIRRRSLQTALAKALLVDIRDLARLFPNLELEASRAGVDFEIWNSIWRLSPRLARLLWRSAFFSGHCFAIAVKQ